jgi:Arm domain-containing DNA-binding protein/integrase-like protein
MALTAMSIKRLTCPESQRQTKKSDGNGLYLIIKNNGSKLWRMRYRYSGKYQELAFGQYPTIPLIEAREMAVKARSLLVQGINPADERRARKRVSKDDERIFGVVALTWWEQQELSWSEEHAKKVKRWIEVEMKPIGKLSVDSIDQGHITELMLSIEASGHRRKAPVVLSVINRIFGYALAHRYTRNNPAQGLPLGDILKPMPKVEHRASSSDHETFGVRSAYS